MSRLPLTTVAREWTRIGVTGFGGPPAHIALLRPLVVDRLAIMDAVEFQDANATCGLLPGPASTQMAIFCAYRAAGPLGAIVGGLGFILPAVILVTALSVLFLAAHTPLWVRGAGAGAGAAVSAVALQAARGFLTPSLAATAGAHARRLRWGIYLGAGAAATVWLGAGLVLVLLGCGAVELVLSGRPGRRERSGGADGSGRPEPSRRPDGSGRPGASGLASVGVGLKVGGLGPLALTALKVGALSFGGGFVIVPLMQGDAVHVYHWMTDAHFLNAVALGQVTPGPVVSTVAAVGYAAAGLPGAALAATIAFLPSFAFILAGAPRFGSLRANPQARAFLDGAGPAAIGAILGAAVLLAEPLTQAWQFLVLGGSIVALLVLRRGVVGVLLSTGALGVLLALVGAPV